MLLKVSVLTSQAARAALVPSQQIEDLIEPSPHSGPLYALVLFCYPFKGHPHSGPLYALVLACFLCGEGITKEY